MPSCIDEAGHTKAFEYPVAEHWGGGAEMFSSAGAAKRLAKHIDLSIS